MAIPKCSKCNDTGVWETGNNDLPCDCPAGRTALFNVAGVPAPLTGAQIQHREDIARSPWCKEHQQYSCLICANGGIGHPIIEKEALDALQTEIGDWCDKTFPNSTQKTILLHFKAEAKELLEATDGETDQEIADCIMLLLHLAHKRRTSARDAIRDKFEICKKRKWGPPDENGVVRHVEE
jgi:NTP pyrophosphatase (non-canonical NTP hydrolase)